MPGPAPIDDLRRDLVVSIGRLVREVRRARRDSGIQNTLLLLAIVTLAAAIVWAAAILRAAGA